MLLGDWIEERTPELCAVIYFAEPTAAYEWHIYDLLHEYNKGESLEAVTAKLPHPDSIPIIERAFRALSEKPSLPRMPLEPSRLQT
jgi:hypothetical protein